jgi:hypothetical protein
LLTRTLHIILIFFITAQSVFTGLSAKSVISNNDTFSNDFTQIQLNKEHAHSETSGILLFNETGEAETETEEFLNNGLKQIKLFSFLISSAVTSEYNHDTDEILKSECFTFHPSLLHIPLFLYNADLRI